MLFNQELLAQFQKALEPFFLFDNDGALSVDSRQPEVPLKERGQFVQHRLLFRRMVVVFGKP
ncbi:MAG: hypothetical protein OHK0048_25040 [Rhodoferax sp.]